MQPGDCFTIEPSLVQGSDSRGSMWDDGWTMATEVRYIALPDAPPEYLLMASPAPGARSSSTRF